MTFAQNDPATKSMKIQFLKTWTRLLYVVWKKSRMPEYRVIAYAPIEERRATASASVHRRTSPSRSASTITRASGSVPEYRSTMRPEFPSARTASPSSRDTSGRESIGGFELTGTLTIF